MKVDDAALVRLQPIQSGGGDRPDVQAVDVRGVGQLANEFLIVCDRRADQCVIDFLEHVRLRALHDRGEREHVLLFSDRVVRRLAMYYHRSQI